MIFNKSIFMFCFLFISLGLVAQQNEALEAGTKAPNFKVDDVYGNSINLRKMAKQQEEGKILLTFMRHAWCPICNARTHSIIENYESLAEKGYTIIVIYQSPNNRLRNYAKDYDLPFIVVADYEQKLYKQYALEFNESKFTPESMELVEDGMDFLGSEENKEKYVDENDVGLDLVPGDFIINSKGVIERAYYGKFIGDHIPIDEL